MSGRSVEHATFVVERKYEASPERAFAAWADPKAKARWFVGSDAHLELDFRVGGREHSQGSAPDGSAYSYEALFQDIVPAQRIVYTYDMLLQETRISVSLATVEYRERPHRALGLGAPAAALEVIPLRRGHQAAVRRRDRLGGSSMSTRGRREGGRRVFEPYAFVGREAVIRWYEQLRETWDAYVTELIGDIIDAADRVVVRQIWHAAGRGPDLNMDATAVYSCARAGSSTRSTSGITPTPSKPWGCRSRRCRRRDHDDGVVTRDP
jgi:uncharacterized protein YndB with AHSA1/START domain